MNERIKPCAVSLYLIIFLIATAGKAQAPFDLSKDSLPGFKQVYIHTVSDVQFYDITAENISEDLQIEAEYPLKVSLQCHDNFTSTLNLSPSQGNINEKIYVRVFPETMGLYSPVITHAASGYTAELSTTLTATESQTPQGYYSTATTSGSRLKTQLYEIIKNHNTQTYSSLWVHFTSTDITFSGKVWDIYSDIPCQEPPYLFTFSDDQDSGSGGGSEGDVYNREHSMPRSWFGGDVDPMNTDLFHIYPVDKYVNAQRANFPFGVVDAPYWTSLNGGKLGNNTAGNTYTGAAFEPIDAYKGDLARSYFYMVTRYEDRLENWTYSDQGNNMLDHNKYPGYQPWVIEMLMEWHDNDPVSHRERIRNDAVYEIQGNRNPFIDSPEYVELIWGDTTLQTSFIDQKYYVRFYPNPARDNVYFASDTPVNEISFYDSNGKEIKKLRNLENTGVINVSSFTAGVYFIRYSTTGNTGIIKLVIYPPGRP
ncbi:MAG: endonuclease [Bacteroidales bacterium]